MEADEPLLSPEVIQFRAEFGDEMHAQYEVATTDAARAEIRREYDETMLYVLHTGKIPEDFAEFSKINTVSS